MITRDSNPNASPFSRRRALLLGGGAAAGAIGALAPRWAAAAPLRLDITQGNVQPIAIALPDFIAGPNLADPDTARGVTQIIASNLQRSGLFAPIDPAAYIDKISNIQTPRFPDWRQINAQALVTGRLYRDGGQLKAEFRLWDV